MPATDCHSAALDIEARRAVMLHDRPLVVDLITLTLNHGVSRSALARTRTFAGSPARRRLPR